MKSWIAKAIIYKAGEGRGAQAEIARLLAEQRKWPDTRGKLNKLLSGAQTITAVDMYDISAVTGYPLPASETGDALLDDFMEAYKRATHKQRAIALAAARVILEKSTEA